MCEVVLPPQEGIEVIRDEEDLEGRESVRRFAVPPPEPWVPEALGRCWGDPAEGPPTSGLMLNPATFCWHLRSCCAALPAPTVVDASIPEAPSPFLLDAHRLSPMSTLLLPQGTHASPTPIFHPGCSGHNYLTPLDIKPPSPVSSVF